MPRVVKNKETVSDVQARLSIRRNPSNIVKRFLCRVCNGHHPLRVCPKFLKMNTEQRMRAVLLHKYCSNCLAHQHSEGSCRSTDGCHYCQQNHHTLLHMGERPRNCDSMIPSSSIPRTLVTVESILAQHVTTLFPTALVRIQINGRLHYARSLLDPCIAVSRISSNLVEHLRVPISKIGIDRVCSLIIRAHSDAHVKIEATFHLTNRIFVKTPSKSLDAKVREKFSNIILADPDFDRCAPVSLVLGADVYPKTILSGVLPSSSGLPVAQNTIFGWVLSGSCST